jgi:predicted hotdog family 3-hydroxylacyl-ACP dehydratase
MFVTPLEAVDSAILQHMHDHPQVHPMSSPHIRRLAAHPDCRHISKTPTIVIQKRMQHLRKSGKYHWQNSGRFYEVLS